MLTRIAIAILAVVAIGLSAQSASASSRQITSFEAPWELFSDQAREPTLDEIQSLGIDDVRALVYWRKFTVDPTATAVPNFDMSDPDAYPAEMWGALDRLVDSVQRRGMRIQLTLTGPVPTWATKGRKGEVREPNARLFGRWAKAVAERYGDRVDFWSIWNEPNHPRFLAPQFRKGKAYSPRLYRKLYSAGEQAIHATAGNSRDKVLFGETAPIGNQKLVAPLAMLRGALCLDEDYRPVGRCSKLRIDGYAHHAYSPKGDPRQVSNDADDIGFGSVGRLVTALDRAASAGVVKPGLGIYLTEYGVESYPDRARGVKLSRQAEYLAISERAAYANPRIKLFSQYLLTDDRTRRNLPRAQWYGGFQTGLRREDGTAKPAYNGFMLPLAAQRYGGQVVFWGRVRPAEGETTVQIERRRGAGLWRVLATVKTRGVYGWRSDYGAKFRYRAVWINDAGERIEGPPVRAY